MDKVIEINNNRFKIKRFKVFDYLEALDILDFINVKKDPLKQEWIKSLLTKGNIERSSKIPHGGEAWFALTEESIEDISINSGYQTVIELVNQVMDYLLKTAVGNDNLDEKKS